MPHSSGGGSHGGGSHGGSFGGSSGSSAPRMQRHYFSGARTFVYYRAGMPHYVYSDTDLRAQKESGRSRFFILLFLIPFCFFMIMALRDEIRAPQMLTGTEAYSVAVEDKANVLDDADRLEAALADFKETTGITPVVLTVHNKVWEDYYSDLETYAYEAYLTRFDDETHWLIVYSEPGNPDESFNDWYWEGMQGDETDSILNQSKLSSFNTELYENLLRSDRYTTEEAIAVAFENLTTHVMTREVDYGEVAGLGFGLLFMLAIAFFVTFGDKLKKFKYEELSEVCGSQKSNPVTATCDYCGGTYTIGAHTRCPHCGATIESGATTEQNT